MNLKTTNLTFTNLTDKLWKRLIAILISPILLCLAVLITIIVSLTYIIDVCVYGPFTWIIYGEFQTLFRYFL